MKAIVTGVAGQDGFYMTNYLLDKGYQVCGLTSNLNNALYQYGETINPRLQLREFDYGKKGEFVTVLTEFQPSLIFNFASKATGRGMFDSPDDMCRINGMFVLDILEAIRQDEYCNNISFCQASSSEMFGNVSESPQTEITKFDPKSPYGAAKLFAHNLVKIYREAYGLRSCSAILYNHESPRRSLQFVTRKIANGAVKVRLGTAEKLTLGSLDARRDWGYAPEYVRAMYLMAVAESVQDFVVATGRLTTIEKLCQIAFSHLGLDYRKCVAVSDSEKRLVDSVNLCGNPSKINAELGWFAQKSVEEIMIEMVDAELRSQQRIYDC